MIPQSNNSKHSKEKSNKSEVYEENKSEQLSTHFVSKAPSFGILACCWKGTNDTQSTVSTNNKLRGRPSSFMAAKTTLTPGKESSKLGNKDGSQVGMNPTYIQNESFARDYPMEQVFILGGKDKIIAKITFVKVAKATSIIDTGRRDLCGLNGSVKDPSFKDNSNSEGDTRPRSQTGFKLDKQLPKKAKKEIFSKYDKGIKVEEWQEITPEKVAIHVANRLKCDTIIDALCGFGGNTIQFAKTCSFVIGIDHKSNKTLWAKHNARIYGVDHKIDFITADFLRIGNLSGDTVFLSPTIIRSKSGEPFSILKHMRPDPLSLLAKSLQVSPRIALQLPGDTQFDELPQFFHQSLEKFDWYSKRFCIEIEKIMNSLNETECIIIYFGDCSSIDQQEEYEAIFEYISAHETLEWKQRFSFDIVKAIIEKVGIRRSFKLLSNIESNPSVNKAKDSLFELFLNKIVQEGLLSKSSLDHLIQEESRRHEWSGFSVPNSYASTKAYTGTNQSLNQMRAETLPKGKTAESSESQPKSQGAMSRLLLESRPRETNEVSLLTDQILKMESPNHKENEDKFAGLTTPPSLLDGPNLTLKNSYDVSELAVSSYSVSSDYLRESSEEGDTSRHYFRSESIENGFDTPNNNVTKVKRKTYSREPPGIEIASKKERCSSQIGEEILKSNDESRSKKDKTNPKDKKEKRKEKELFRSASPVSGDKEVSNRSFQFQYGDDF